MKTRQSFQSLYQKLPVAKRTQIEKCVSETLAEMELKELRAYQELSQTVVGEALGGSLELIAHFPEGDVKINHS
jgi:hypothetical protein